MRADFFEQPLNSTIHRRALTTAITAARAAGALMRSNFHSVKKINEATQHDINSNSMSVAKN